VIGDENRATVYIYIAHFYAELLLHFGPCSMDPRRDFSTRVHATGILFNLDQSHAIVIDNH